MNETTNRHIELLETAGAYVIKELSLIDKETAKQVLNIASTIKLHVFEDSAVEFSGYMSAIENRLTADFLKGTTALLKIFLTPSWEDLLACLANSGTFDGLVVPTNNGNNTLTIAENAPDSTFKTQVIQKCQWLIPLILIRLNAQTVAETFASPTP